MKNLTYYILPGLLMVTALLISPVVARAQNADSSVASIAARLSVSTNEAKQVKAAYNYNHAEIDRLMKPTKMGAKEQFQLLKKALAERNQQVDAAVTPVERARLKDTRAGAKERVQTVTAAMRQRRAEQLARTPHQVLSSSQATDTSSTKNH